MLAQIGGDALAGHRPMRALISWIAAINGQVNSISQVIE